MKRVLFLILLTALLNPLWSQTSSKLSIENIFKGNLLQLKHLNNPKWLPGQNAFVFLKRDKSSKVTSLFIRRVADGREEVWIDGKALIDPANNKPIHFMDYRIAPSGTKILFKTDAKRVWRHYDDARYFVFDLRTQTMRPVYDGPERIRHAKFSPDESQIAYVRGNNLYIKDLTSGKVTQITKDGSDVYLNGLSDWVYEEEFGQADGWRWSPDGRQIAFYHFDQSPIKTFSWIEYDDLDVHVKTVPYPKAGDPNSIVTIGVYHLDSGKTTWMNLGPETDQYIPRIRWTKHAHILMIERMNRLQNTLDVLLANTESGDSRVLYTETDPAWISITDNVFFLNDKTHMIRTSEASGFNHIWEYDLDSGQKRQITSGNWEVETVYGIDEVNDYIYFQANKGNMEERRLFRIKRDGTGLEQISREPGSHSAQFAPDFSAFIHTYSNVHTPPQTVLCSADGQLIRSLIQNSADSLKPFHLAYPEFTSFTTSDGVEIKAMITKPVDFDPTKKYPVLIYGYSGPASQLVLNRWGRTSSKLWYTLLTQKGYIIFTLDQRGTGGRGKAFKNLAYGDIGKYMLKDHIEGVQYLRSLPYVDGSRIGIWGWSGGGYLTLMAMTKGAAYFKAGVAVAPVSDFRLYDNIWTERYMGLPQTNPAGYDSTSALTYTNRYKGGLLVIHGTSDDNVHMQNTMQFIEKLELAGKPFNLMIYPGRNHSMLGQSGSVYYHLYKTMTNFILQNL